MGQTREFIVCFDFVEPVDVSMAPGDALNQKLRNAVVVEASEPFARYLGFESRQELIGRHMMDLFKGVVPPWFIGYGQEVEDSGFKDLERVVSVPVGSGGVIHARIHMQNIIENGHLTRQWVTVRDVTKETEQKRELEASERTKGLALKAANLHTFSVEFDSGKVNVDPGGLDTIAPGVGAKSLAEWAGMIHRSDFEKAAERLDAFRSGHLDSLHMEFRVSTQREETRWVEVWGRATERDAEERASGVAGVYRDTTESRELESRVRSVQKLETLGMLAGGIAHDFNNLLVPILGNAELTLADLEPGSDSSARIGEIVQASQRAAELTEQLLAYAGKGQFTVRDLDLSGLVTDMASLLRTSVPKTAEMRLELSQEKVWLRGDPTQIRQVVMNLITNAGEALDGRPGTVTLETGTISADPVDLARYPLADGLEPGQYSYLEVSDDGSGMEPETLARIFDPFFTTKFQGRGLGLAALLGIVRSHRGGIRVESEPKRGTTFRVLFPCVPPSEEATSEPVPEAWSGKGTILVVDDEPLVRSTVRAVLENQGFEVLTAAGGPGAVGLLRGRDADVAGVLLDLAMPGMDGEATFQALRAAHPDLPVLFMSGHSSEEIDARLVGRERVGRIRKPFRAAELASALRQLLRD